MRPTVLGASSLLSQISERQDLRIKIDLFGYQESKLYSTKNVLQARNSQYNTNRGIKIVLFVSKVRVYAENVLLRNMSCV